jgi:integrase
VRVHDTRHSYASLQLRRGVPIVYVSKQLGHSSIAVTVDL